MRFNANGIFNGASLYRSIREIGFALSEIYKRRFFSFLALLYVSVVAVRVANRGIYDC